jgi:hypothetical protein
MTRSTFAIVLLAAACSSSKHGNMGSPDAPAGNPDAARDAPAMGSNGVYAIPLTTPAGSDQGLFYTPTLTTEGASFLLDLDTGSTDTGIAGTSCTTCTGLSPLYKPGTAATDTKMMDSVQYADGSMWSGEVYTDTVGLGHGSPSVTLNLVEITSQTSFFANNEYQGILGVGPDALLGTGTTAYLDQVFGAGVAKKLAVEMCPTDGTLWLGGYDATHASAAMQYTPLLGSGGFYGASMTKMALGTGDLGVTGATLQGPIVDTGTSLFYIPTTAEAKLIADINADAKYKTLFPGQTLTDPSGSGATAGCVTAKAGTTDAQVDDQLPAFAMSFDKVGGGTFTIDAAPTRSYFYNAGAGQYCMAIFGGGDGPGGAVMGDVFLRSFVTEIDIGNNQIGFAPTATCVAPALASEPPARRLVERGHGPSHRPLLR